MTPRNRADDQFVNAFLSVAVPAMIVGAFRLLAPFIMLSIILGCLVAAQAAPPGNPTVRIRQQVCTESGCGWGFGSGTLIGGLRDGRLAVLSCAHIIHGEQPPLVDMPGGTVEGEIAALDPHLDLSLIAVRYPGRVPVMLLSREAPPDNAVVRVAGFGERFESRQTRLMDLTPDGNNRVEGVFNPGESGGTVALRIGPQLEAVVGVIVSRDTDRVPKRFRHGFIVPWSRVCPFVLAANGGEFPRTEQDPPAAAPLDAPQPFKRSVPVPNAELGEAAPTEEPPVVVIRPPEKTPEAAPIEGTPTEIDWSLARIVVVVPRQEGLNAFDWILRLFQRLTTADAGPGAAVRNWVSEYTDGKADVRIIYERTRPDDYGRVVSESGVKPGKFASVVFLVKKQGGGLLDPLKTLATRIGERIKERSIPDGLPVEVILERTNPTAFEAVNNAVDAATVPGGEQPVGPLETILGVFYAIVRACRGWIGRGEVS